MKTSILKKLTIGIVLVVMLVSFSGCVPMGKYSLVKAPTEDTTSFQTIEVTKIKVGATTDEVAPEIPVELRTAIIEAIQKEDTYQSVLAELDNGEAALRIDCKIIELDNGSRFARWALGFGAGKAHLDASCQFVNTETNNVFATGMFTGEIKGGIFGGGADQKEMSKQVAAAIARFLKKGK